ncbi:MAG: SPOR domain-containing protein, partial [Gammaproteobacteria bacterium]
TDTHEQMVMAQQNYLARHYKVSFGQVQTAARLGDPDAQYALGYMFYYGIGTPQDTRLGTYWIKCAAAQGQPQAIDALQILDNTREPPSVPEDSTPFFDDSQAIRASKAAARRNKATRISSTSRSSRRLVKPITLPKSLAASDEPITPQVSTPQVSPINQEMGDSPVPDNNVNNKVQIQSSAEAPITRQITPITQLTPYSPMLRNEVNNNKQDPASAGGTRSYTAAEHKLLTAPSSNYTLQLLDVRHEEDAISFIRKHNLQDRVSYYCAYRNGRPMYIVVYGQFDSSKEAHAAIRTLPEKVQQLKPWVKSLAKVQRDLKN